MVLVEGHLADGSGAAAVGARSIAERLFVPHVLRSELLVVGSQLRVLVPLVLGLQGEKQKLTIHTYN